MTRIGAGAVALAFEAALVFGAAAQGARAAPELAGMDLRAKIGQLVVAGFDGRDAEGQAATLVRDYMVSGFILYRRNYGSDSSSLASLTASLRALVEPGSPGLLMCIDEEGGTVSRIEESGEGFPSASWLGRGSPEGCRAVARRIGSALRSAGIDVNFAPVLDLYRREHSSFFASRAFGSTPRDVSLFGEAFAEGLLDEGICPVIKHYPGQGLLGEDTHDSGGSIMRDLEWMSVNDSAPFETILRRLPVGVMMNHVAYPLIDPSRLPASRSSYFMRDRLRGELGFEGLVFIDEVTMGGFAPEGDLGEAAVQAVANGADILIAAHSFEAQRLVLDSLYRAALRGRISASRLDESVGRILAFKRELAGDLTMR